MFAKPVISSVWYYDSSLFWINGSKGEIGRIAKRTFGDGLEECRFADIGQTDLSVLSVFASVVSRSQATYNPTFEIVPRSAQKDLFLFDLLFWPHSPFGVCSMTSKVRSWRTACG